MKIEHWQLKQRQAEPLDVKILMSKERIKQWYNHWDGEVYVAFSGGLDSTVLLHMVRSIYPDVPAVFNNTGVEFPEIVKFVRGTENVVWGRPRKRFHRVVHEYGYPVVSKRIAQYVHEVQHSRGETATKRLRLTGIKTDGTYTALGRISKKWLFLCDAPFGVSDRCCFWLKKDPSKRIEKEYGRGILGIRADESKQREQNYLMHKCNAYDFKRPRSWPLAFWMHQDIWDYIHLHNIPYSPIYDMGYSSTGCFPCMFGVHMEDYPNRFQRMYDTHPKLWVYCMNKLGIQQVLDYIGIESKP